MLKEERFEYILKKLGIDNKVLSTELSKELNVSDDTVRRDLNELYLKGLIKKVHGGAVPPKASIPLDYEERISYSETEKHDIALKALSLFTDAQLVIIDGGTTNLEVVRLLPVDIKITIFTNSIPVAMHLSNYPDVELIFMGGKILKPSRVSIGSEVIQMLDNIRADFSLLGVTSVHPDIGLTVRDWEESKIKEKIVKVSNKVIGLVTNDKLNKADNYLICEYKNIDTLIIDKNVDEEKLIPYKKSGVKIIY